MVLNNKRSHFMQRMFAFHLGTDKIGSDQCPCPGTVSEDKPSLKRSSHLPVLVPRFHPAVHFGAYLFVWP